MFCKQQINKYSWHNILLSLHSIFFGVTRLRVTQLLLHLDPHPHPLYTDERQWHGQQKREESWAVTGARKYKTAFYRRKENAFSQFGFSNSSFFYFGPCISDQCPPKPTTLTVGCLHHKGKQSLVSGERKQWKWETDVARGGEVGWWSGWRQHWNRAYSTTQTLILTDTG